MFCWLLMQCEGTRSRRCSDTVWGWGGATVMIGLARGWGWDGVGSERSSALPNVLSQSLHAESMIGKH